MQPHCIRQAHASVIMHHSDPVTDEGGRAPGTMARMQHIIACNDLDADVGMDKSGAGSHAL